SDFTCSRILSLSHLVFFFSRRRRHTRFSRDWSSDVCSSDLKIPLVIANARLSERSAKGYGKLGKFMRRLLSKITLIAAQNEEDAARFIALGLKRNQLAVTGSLKFDISVTPELAARAVTLRRQ